MPLNNELDREAILNSMSLESLDCLKSTETEVAAKLEVTSQPEVSTTNYKPRIIWLNVFFITLFHVVAVYTIIFKVYQLKFVSIFYGYIVGLIGGFGVTGGAHRLWAHNSYKAMWPLRLILLFCYPVAGYIVGQIGGFGVTGGVHRLWAHKSYKAKWPLRLILLFCYSVAGQNTVYEWVRDHRVHHKFSETDADPHNSNRGFFFAHVGWLMQRKHPEVYRRGVQVDMSDILQDPLITFHTKYFTIIKLLCCFIIPTVIPIYFWNEDVTLTILCSCFVRYTLGLNFTWLVNSAAHIYGNKPYDKRINPAENLSVAILAMGEGWHNYHHVFPWDYKAAELGNYKYNYTTALIDMFANIGWAYDLKSASPSLVKSVLQRHGDGTHLSLHDQLAN